jgi:hypothetical protein
MNPDQEGFAITLSPPNSSSGSRPTPTLLWVLHALLTIFVYDEESLKQVRCFIQNNGRPIIDNMDNMDNKYYVFEKKECPVSFWFCDN